MSERCTGYLTDRVPPGQAKTRCLRGSGCGLVGCPDELARRVQRTDPAPTGQTTSQSIRRVTRRDLLAKAPPLVGDDEP